MNKYDEQLNRMSFLMEYKTPKTSVVSNIEYHANGADGKVYGILKEGTKYYIKSTESGKENISESYEYLGGFNRRKEHEYKSYNEATKQLELKLMSLNEAAGKHEDVSTVDFKRGEKTLGMLTEAARNELNRMQEIFENSCNIGKKDCICDKEAKGKSTGEQTTKNNDPFKEKVTADMEFDGKNGTVEGATEFKTVDEGNKINNDLQSDKMKTENGGSIEKDFKDTHDDLDGEGVADKKPTGAKAVKMNESLEIDGFDDNEVAPAIDADALGAEGGEADAVVNDMNLDNVPADETPLEEPETSELTDADFESEDELAGTDDEFEHLLEQFEEVINSNENKSTIVGPEKVMDGDTAMNMKEEQNIENADVEAPKEENLKSFNKKGNMPPISWEHMNESIAKITESVYKKLGVKPVVKESVEDKIKRIVREEVTKLNVWGKHPRFRQQPMTLPQNKEVMAGTADRDFNDDSAKGEKPYGEKVGDGAPFNKTVEMLTDQVMSQLKESLKKGK